LASISICPFAPSEFAGSVTDTASLAAVIPAKAPGPVVTKAVGAAGMDGMPGPVYVLLKTVPTVVELKVQ
jgi:hypothetical protein